MVRKDVIRMNYVRFAITALIMTIGSLLIAFGFNRLLIPHQLLSGGLSGFAMIIGYVVGGNIGWLYLALNVPVLVWGLYRLGRRFIGWSIYSVLTATFFMQIIPVAPIANDILLGAVFGGILLGLGSGIALRYGGSSGGFDIVASIVTQKRDFPVGMVIFLLNGLVVVLLGLITRSWEPSLYSLVSIFTAGKVVDLVHIRHVKVTAFIVTTKTDEMLQRLLTRPRGVTVIPTRGGYSSAKQDMLMTVTTRYELHELRKLIRSVDARAFVNIVETAGIMGEFRRIDD